MSKDVIEKYVVYNSCFGGFGLSKLALEWLKDRGLIFDHQYEIDRHDALLVMCVMELGEAACGDFARLRLHKMIGDRYEIREYDGVETVVEPSNIEWTIL